MHDVVLHDLVARFVLEHHQLRHRSDVVEVGCDRCLFLVVEQQRQNLRDRFVEVLLLPLDGVQIMRLLLEPLHRIQQELHFADYVVRLSLDQHVEFDVGVLRLFHVLFEPILIAHDADNTARLIVFDFVDEEFQRLEHRRYVIENQRASIEIQNARRSGVRFVDVVVLCFTACSLNQLNRTARIFDHAVSRTIVVSVVDLGVVFFVLIVHQTL
mmetsp:Transcript_3150/g.5334  ORF Transcript_3150/g.5334 Transcript_3150/m.5334 type:complete len:213 (+) Transcript_3150:277-915(+)